MILTVSTFRSKVLSGGAGDLIAELVDLTGRDTAEERKAWTESFTRLAHAFDSPALAPMHLYFGNQGNLALEYRLPASSSWCDVVLLGRNDRMPAAVILELKHWDTRSDNCPPHPGLILRREGLWLHPAEQVKGYTEYCRRFHSVVQDSGAQVDGCVVFTARPLNPSYCCNPNLELVREFPCFSIAAPDEARIVDLVVAVSLGTLCSGFFHGITGSVTTSPMSQLPLVLIPAYFVPLFIMLHFTALFQARRLKGSECHPVDPEPFLPENIPMPSRHFS